MAHNRDTSAAPDSDVTPNESRQAVTGHGANIVLLVSMVLAVLAGLTLLGSFMWIN